ncbi:MAG: signal peptidase I [Gemmatimonadetes bacterium]|nr:signal peptidase I [Gemmatimonadota bacterium]
MSKKKNQKKKRGGDTLRTAIYALAIALFVRTFFVQAFRIPSGSMEDTLLIGDFLLVDKITFGAKVPGTDWRLPGFRDPRRGDILVFKDPRTNRDYIKRCIATGGETLELKDNVVFIDGQEIQEPYKAVKPVFGPTRKDFGPRTIPPEALFMMGDNRNNSQDSRYWDALAPDRVVGRAFVLYWSTDPDGAPQFVRDLDDGLMKGFLQLVLGKPRLTRLGTWLAKDYSETYGLTAAGLPVPDRADFASAGGADGEGAGSSTP